MHQDIDQVLFSEDQIRSAIDRVAREVEAAYAPAASPGTAGRDLVVVSVLKGSCIFASDLIRRLPLPLELAFVAASSYRDGTTAGDLELNFFPTEAEIEGRALLLVDDILDTGRTMAALTEELLGRGAASVRTCVFLDKPARRTTAVRADFRCFEVEDLFVVGYGLDFAGRYRNLPYVGALRAELYGG